ncbi:hypothetical protein [Clostridium sp.]
MKLVIDTEIIAKSTGLSLEKILELKKKYENQKFKDNKNRD